MKLRFTPRATEDLTAIGDYIRTRNPAAAVRVRAAILETLQMLVLFPHAGRAQSVEGVRKIVTLRYAYIVYYSVDTDSQEIPCNVLRASASTAISEHTA
jgi:plasmid stabilization system protein ParE